MPRIAIDKFFKDRNGRWAIAQFPNVLITGWIVVLLANLFLHSQPVKSLQDALLFAWAYMELIQGVSYFRKVLGAVVLIGLVVSFFV